MVGDVEESLDLLDDEYVNKHLIVSIVDLIAVRLFPELIEAGEEDGEDGSHQRNAF